MTTLGASLSLGFSPCPNDTFMFHAWVSGALGDHVPRVSPTLLDIEALNQRALGAGALGQRAPGAREPAASGVDATAFEVTKLSAGALPFVLDRYVPIPSGAAMGRGCGPLVVVRDGSAAHGLGDLAHATVAIPGPYTTAALLLRIFGPATLRLVPMRFDAIMPSVARGDCDAGVIIHESRFVYREHGLRSVLDLGEAWEQDTGHLLPLGIIVARRDLGASRIEQVRFAMRASVEAARRDPAASAAYVRAHARELSDEVCARHIALYVNEWSIEVGEEGRAALGALIERGREVRALPPGPPPFG